MLFRFCVSHRGQGASRTIDAKERKSYPPSERPDRPRNRRPFYPNPSAVVPALSIRFDQSDLFQQPHQPRLLVQRQVRVSLNAEMMADKPVEVLPIQLFCGTDIADCP